MHVRVLRSGGVVASAQVLARDVVYELIPVGQRRDWHARHAFAMELCRGRDAAQTFLYRLMKLCSTYAVLCRRAL